jgi:hypothetical protein
LQTKPIFKTGHLPAWRNARFLSLDNPLKSERRYRRSADLLILAIACGDFGDGRPGDVAQDQVEQGHVGRRNGTRAVSDLIFAMTVSGNTAANGLSIDGAAAVATSAGE